MIKIEQNAEIKQVIAKIKTNIVATMDFWGVLDTYKRKKATIPVERKLLELYAKFGYQPSTLRLSASEFYRMPYNQQIRLDAIQDENVEIKTYELPKLHLEPSDFGNKDRYMRNYTRLAYYDKDIKAPMIVEKGGTWMSPTLAERNTMQEAVDKAHGKVLTFGLGIGYFPYTSLLKNEVKSVTIIEKNERIIEIFKKHILPQFNTDKPIDIIHGDLFDYYNEEFLNRYDYVFVDIWKNETDGFPIYEQMIKRNVQGSHIDYWIENTLFFTFQDMVFSYLKAVYEQNLTERLAYFREDPETGHMINMIHGYFRGVDKTIGTEDEFLLYLNDKATLKEMLRF
ncbi:hypothetical protein PP175_28860 (plasmid) [Aneurinibacillus sp. Ricciae_BoGa-3]|uniref:hypothetical protein n=1 Tax=Aneurinibacillus sp. Ricciae_BoGa-3 TaxID=3022697 RepID=UPI0023422C4B|nr:hypothetical protein [Aneurinibacillus sp. Ricciae_BoGa-3]WCK57202.1 hypothetical protein PP175_28860 [Aneurinibacillus sp. Ricciae_BoGa-3]